jgi:hypothetical protein
MAMIVMGYSSFAGSDFSTADTLHAGWTYNFFWMMATWGIQLLLWVERLLFKSDGGLFDKLFIKWVNFGVLNIFLFYWAIDLFILYGTLDYTIAVGESKNNWYFKFIGLWAIQAMSVYVNIMFRDSLNFDWDLTQAIPQAYMEAKTEYVPEEVTDDTTEEPLSSDQDQS